MTTVSSTDSIATFAAVFATLWVAHTIGDLWLNAAKCVSTSVGVSLRALAVLAASY